MKDNNKKRSTTKIFIIVLAVTAIAFLITALLLAIPKLNAEKKLNFLKEIVRSEKLESVTVYQHTPYETGSFEQVTRVFEKRLDKDEMEEFSLIFSEITSRADYAGSSGSYYAMTDYKIIIRYDGKMTAFYVSENSVYTLDGTLMTSFHCKDSSLYDFFNTMKEAYYNND